MNKVVTTTKKNTAVAKPLTDEQRALLGDQFPAEAGFNRKWYPRLGMVSQHQTEEVRDPKTKKITLNMITEAGTFFTDKPDPEEKDEKGNPVQVHEELGMEIEATIIYKRYQLKYYNKDTEEFTSSPIFDSEEEIVPLFLNKKEIARGTPKELMAREEYIEIKDGKEKSKLEYNRVLYVLFQGELFQMNFRGSSMYSYMTYARKNTPPTVLTKFSSEAKESGDIKWNQMSFETVRELNSDEADLVLEKLAEIKQDIVDEKASFSKKSSEESEAERKAREDFDKI